MSSTFKHPAGFWILSLTGVFYCFAFGSITSLLILYLTQQGHLATHDAYSLFASLNALLFILPLLGGYLSERLGFRLGITVGLCTMLLATLSLAMPHRSAAIFGIACFAAGNAFVTPSTYALIGLHYEENALLRNSAYTLYYLLFNLGFFFSSLFAGFIAEHSFYTAFAVAAGSTIVALIIFASCFYLLVPAKGSSFAPRVPWPFWARLPVFILTACILILISIFMLHHVTLNNIVFFTLTVVVSLGLLIAALRQKERSRKLKMIAFLILCIFSVGFWSLYMLEPSLVTVFVSTNVNRVIGGFTIPASSYYALDSFFIIVLGFFFSWLWHYLAKHKRDLSLPAKFSSSLLSMAIGYLIFAVAIFFANHTTYLVNSSWIVLAYVFIGSAELLISPIGLSMIGVLMPKGREGLGVGIWQVYTGLSGVISGYLANLANTPAEGLPQQTNPIFMDSFIKIGLGTLVIGLIMCVLTPKIRPLLIKQS